MKKRILVLIVLSIVLVNLSFISAGIYFSDLQSTYNLGELVKLEVSVDPIYPEYLLKVDLMCNGNEVIPFNNFPNEEGLVNIVLPLNYYTLKEVSGDCYFSAQYGNEERETKHFEISKRLDVKLDTSSYFNNPGETLTISGSAKRLNGVGANGDIEITIPLLKTITYSGDNKSSENKSILNHLM